MTVRVTSEARMDLENIVDWYNQQEPGVGHLFASNFEQRLALIPDFPLEGEEIRNPFRRIFLTKFPYSIVYFVDETQFEIVILAVIHQFRNPEVITGRIRNAFTR